MSTSKPASPTPPAQTAQERAEGRRAERLAAALRDNLKRRKAQQRARLDSDDPERAPALDGDGAARTPAGRRKP